jgi:S-methylmethionine-dependent homocysteine/selenocysteine methylase
MSTTSTLPHLAGPVFITDGGLETTLVFQHGIPLPDFAAFPLLDTDEGRTALTRYFDAYLDVAQRDGAGIVLDTPTWRANPDWGARFGLDAEALAEVNRRSVEFVRELASDRDGLPVVLNGVIGPRGDGYVVSEAMSAAEAANYHALQARAFAEAGAAMITAVTMTYVDEAIGVTRAAAEAGLPVVISFTVETDGRLPSGQPLGEAIVAVDAATGSEPVYYMVNCAHPSHFDHILSGGTDWLQRVKAIRANASRMSHEELDNAEELDRGDPAELARDYLALRRLLPDLRVVGGCCGTDHEHISAISAAFTGR